MISNCSIASSIYVKQLSSGQDEVTGTLTTGLSINHLISVLAVMLFKSLIQESLGIENYPDELYYTMMEHAMNFAGLVMLYRLCKPYNAFRAVLFGGISVVLLAVSIVAVVNGFPMFSFVAMNDLGLYWHHLLLLLCVVLLCVSLAGVLESIANKFLISQKQHPQPNLNKKTK